MNAVLLRFLVVIAGLSLLVFLFARLAPKSWIKRTHAIVTWLIEITFLYFVNFLIFIKPWKEHKQKVGVFVWLFFVFLVGRYLIVEQPLITEVQSPYIPFIGYIYFVSLLYLVKFVFEFTVKDLHTAE